MKTDAQLVKDWAAGDQRAGYELYRRHASAVVRFFRNKVAEKDVDDLLQTTFMKCFEHAGRYDPEASFRGFLLGFARNLLLHHYRSWARKGEKIDFGVTSVKELGVSPSGFVAKREDEQRLLMALRSLPLEHQILLELFYWENMDGKAIAQMYEAPEGTIRTRLRRARQLLQKALEQLTGAPVDDMGIQTWARDIRARIPDNSAHAKGD